MCGCTQRNPRRVLDPLELELQTVVKLLVMGVGNQTLVH